MGRKERDHGGIGLDCDIPSKVNKVEGARLKCRGRRIGMRRERGEGTFGVFIGAEVFGCINKKK